MLIMSNLLKSIYILLEGRMWCIKLRFQKILIDFLTIKKLYGFQSRQSRLFFPTTKSVGIQLRFVRTYKMSLNIENLTDFNGFFCGIDCVRLFS